MRSPMAMTVRVAMAFSDVFLILAVVFFAVLLLVPLARRPQPVAAGAGGIDTRTPLQPNAG